MDTTDDIDNKNRKLDNSLSKDADYYKMDNPSRGLAVIFNQERFENSLYNRRGSNIDKESLEKTFNRLKFEVEIFNDLKRKTIESVILSLSKRDFSKSDCFVMVFMSHGLEGKLLAYDDLIDINILWDKFTGDQCPTLVNKPKLFFIQACQGEKSQGSVGIEVGGTKMASEDQDLTPSYRIPNWADFLVAIATIPGYVSWRNIDTGTYFIQSLCENLDKDGFNVDILTLLTRVNRKVAIDFENCAKKSVLGNCSKQLPTIISMLIRTLKFKDKKTKKEEDTKYCCYTHQCLSNKKRKFDDRK